tara:strand:+ start:3224 stop:3559 length:336 start_codon:yes stop_codon:yes gene_type:complete
MSGLDYSFTCPDLDALINQAKAEISSYVEDTFRENNPEIMNLFCNLPKEIQEKLDTESQYLYDLLDPLFEGSRGINEGIREASDQQINELQEHLEDLQEELRVAQEEEEDE